MNYRIQGNKYTLCLMKHELTNIIFYIDISLDFNKQLTTIGTYVSSILYVIKTVL